MSSHSGKTNSVGADMRPRAVLYGRYSSHNQKDASIEQQFRECRQFAESRDIQIIGEYADHALTGKTDKRPEFQRMIRDAQRGRFQYVITWKVDRFARNREDAAVYKGRLKKYGVKVLYAKESIPEGSAGILLEGMLESTAEWYSATLSENIRRGMEDNARECRANGSRVIGYRVGSDGRFEIDPATVHIVRTIFQRYNEGATQQAIADELNTKGFRTIRGNRFSSNSLTRILRNEKYIGIYKYADIKAEGGMPQIIEKELFDSVQLKMERNKRAPAHRWDIADYKLTTKLFCGHCGSAMTGRAGTGKLGKKYDYYACVGRTKRKACDKKPVAKNWIEEAVVRYTVECVLSDEMIESIAQQTVDLQNRERDRSVLNSLESKLRDVEKAIKNIMNAIEQGIITPSTKSRLMELEDDKATLEAQIEREHIVRPTIPRETLVEILRGFKGGDYTDPDFQSKIIELFISAVYLYDDKVVITYNFNKDGKRATLDFINEQVEKMDDLEDIENLSVSGPSKGSPLDASAPPQFV